MSSTLVTQPLLAENDRKDVADALEKIAKAYRDGHADAEVHESVQLLLQKKVIADISPFMPLFVKGQHVAKQEQVKNPPKAVAGSAPTSAVSTPSNNNVSTPAPSVSLSTPSKK